MKLKHISSKIVDVSSWVEPEALIWIAGLIFLATVDFAADSHFSICPFHALGITWCPGCGLGRSVGFLLHGQIRQSFQMHPLGIIALPILMHRIVSLEFSRIRLILRTQSSFSERTSNGQRISIPS